jgi:hypothetical protein
MENKQGSGGWKFNRWQLLGLSMVSYSALDMGDTGATVPPFMIST